MQPQDHGAQPANLRADAPAFVGGPAPGVGSLAARLVRPSTPPAPPANASRDALWRGRLPIWQPARKQGYRFTLDAVLLAGFAPACPHGLVLELGAGCGIVGLMLLALNKAGRLLAVERQPTQAALAARNVADYGWQARAEVRAGDLRELVLPRANLVVFNPPYFPAADSRPSLEPGRDAGRRECFGTLADFVARGEMGLGPGGALACIVPYSRRLELHGLVAAAGLTPSVERAVQPRQALPPRHLLLAARRGGAATTRMPPLVVHQDGGGYTDEVQALIDGPDAWPGPPGGGADLSPSAG